MANRGGTHPIMGVKDNLHLLTAQLTGGGAAANLANAESSNRGAGEVVSATYSATGVFSVVFRHSYPELKSVLGVQVVGTTDGLRGQFSAIDVAAKTATLEMYVGSTKTDPATTDTIYINLLVRNSGFNT